MQLLRHFTIRRVVLWIMIISFIIVALAGGYSSLVLRNMYNHIDQTQKITQQLAFLAQASTIKGNGNQAEIAALQAAVPADAAWDNYRIALTAPQIIYINAVKERLNSLQEQTGRDNASVNVERHRLYFIFISALIAAAILLIFCDHYLVVHLVRPVGKIRAHLRVITSGDLTKEPEDAWGDWFHWSGKCSTACSISFRRYAITLHY